METSVLALIMSVIIDKVADYFLISFYFQTKVNMEPGPAVGYSSESEDESVNSRCILCAAYVPDDLLRQHLVKLHGVTTSHKFILDICTICAATEEQKKMLFETIKNQKVEILISPGPTPLFNYQTRVLILPRDCLIYLGPWDSLFVDDYNYNILLLH